MATPNFNQEKSMAMKPEAMAADSGLSPHVFLLDLSLGHS
jgi:hypothetical protein